MEPRNCGLDYTSTDAIPLGKVQEAEFWWCTRLANVSSLTTLLVATTRYPKTWFIQRQCETEQYNLLGLVAIR